jgi:hypothetical protein
MTAYYPNRYRYRDRDRFTLQFDIDSDTDFDFDEALANTNKSKMINGGRRDWRLPSTKQSKNVHFFELWDHCVSNFEFRHSNLYTFIVAPGEGTPPGVKNKIHIGAPTGL